VCERRVAKSTRKTLNDRRVAGTRAAHAESAPRVTSARTEPAGRVRLSEELVRLACLCQAGVLTVTEFEAAKARALDQYRNSSPGD
jgi:hypothetical protein